MCKLHFIIFLRQRTGPITIHPMSVFECTYIIITSFKYRKHYRHLCRILKMVALLFHGWSWKVRTTADRERESMFHYESFPLCTQVRQRTNLGMQNKTSRNIYQGWDANDQTQVDIVPRLTVNVKLGLLLICSLPSYPENTICWPVPDQSNKSGRGGTSAKEVFTRYYAFTNME